MGITLISSSKFKVFFPSPFIHSNTIKSVSFFSSVFLSTQLLFKSNFLVHIFFSFHRILQEIVPGGGRRGQGHGLTLGSIDDLCMCVFVFCVCVSQGFSVVLLSSLWCECVPLGWEGG